MPPATHTRAASPYSRNISAGAKPTGRPVHGLNCCEQQVETNRLSTCSIAARATRVACRSRKMKLDMRATHQAGPSSLTTLGEQNKDEELRSIGVSRPANSKRLGARGTSTHRTSRTQ